jgi:preprotein translocase subunit SecG
LTVTTFLLVFLFFFCFLSLRTATWWSGAPLLGTWQQQQQPK